MIDYEDAEYDIANKEVNDKGVNNENKYSYPSPLHVKCMPV